MAIAGPTVQMPTPVTEFLTAGKTLATGWAAFFNALQMISFDGTRSGLTADRPTSLMQGRWIGMMFYDTTLGKPIWLHSVSPDVWHDATGAVV